MKISDNILIVKNKKIVFPSSINTFIEFDDVYIISYCPRTDKEYIDKDISGICGIEKEKGVIKWKISIQPLSMRKVIYNNQEVLNTRIDDVIYIIDVQNGNIIFKTQTKG
jgi:hypothetical protein